MDIDEVRRHRVGVLMSGGLSCTAVGAWLAEAGVDTISFVADLGQDSPLPAAGLAQALEERGLPTRLVDLRAATADFFLDLVRYQGRYEGGYWNTTSGSREVLVAGLAAPLRAAGCTMLVHGCVGGGNDQGRFARYGAALAPDLQVFTPWTQAWLLNRFPDRRSMTDYLTARGFPEAFTGFTTYSLDGNLGGYSHDGDDLEDLTTSARAVTPLMTRWPQDAVDETERFEVRFAAGRPVAVNGTAVDALSALEQANTIGARNGLSMRSIVENRVNGTKCRGVYEAPGLELLGQCLAALYQVTLDKPATAIRQDLSRRIGRAAYEGTLHDTASRAARTALDVLSANANGTVVASLYKGDVLIEELRTDEKPPGVYHQTRFTHGGHHWHTELQPA